MQTVDIDINLVRPIIKPRNKAAHKGDFGHGGIIAGSRGMMGAAVLSSKAFVRSGGGKLTVHVPGCGYNIMQISVPEAMTKTEPGENHIESISALDRYDVLAIGPGLGLHDSHQQLLSSIFAQFHKPVVLDADALNVISKHHTLLGQIPENSVLTPHAAEFERLFGKAENRSQQIHLALENAKRYQIVIVVKGAGTIVALPDGTAFTNTTGNPGMATGGTGDVLTGIISGLIAQQIDPPKAAIAGVYLHGLAGDIAAKHKSEYSLIASDIINYLGDAYLQLHG
jgi:hydroxyethylthiazole kinase-like uncharacterized protein yjeF